MSFSLASKLGTAGAITATGGAAGTYYVWDYITLFEVEREVINRKVALTSSKTSDDLITIKATINESETSKEESKLLHGYSWSCEISLIKAEGVTNSEAETANSTLSTKLSSLSDDKRKFLVKACSKDRKGKTSDKSIIGTLKAKVTAESDSKKTYSFENYTELNDLFKPNN